MYRGVMDTCCARVWTICYIQNNPSVLEGVTLGSGKVLGQLNSKPIRVLLTEEEKVYLRESVVY